jgi:hypothetical protein
VAALSYGCDRLGALKIRLVNRDNDSAAGGCLPFWVKLASTPGSTVTMARPFTRTTLDSPGTMNTRLTRPSRTILRRLSIQLLPCQSGSSRVCASMIRTKGPK